MAMGAANPPRKIDFGSSGIKQLHSCRWDYFRVSTRRLQKRTRHSHGSEKLKDSLQLALQPRLKYEVGHVGSSNSVLVSSSASSSKKPEVKSS